MLDVFENGCLGCYINIGIDEDGNFVFEYIFSWSVIRIIDMECRYLLVVLESYFVYFYGVNVVVKFGLSGICIECIIESVCEVVDLMNVD